MIVLPLDAAHAALPDLEPTFAVRSWDSEDGLPQAPVNALAQTAEGYLWLGTGVGLARFDGARFQIFQTNQTPALGDNRITSLLVDDGGVLWVGTRAGTLARREGNDFVSVPLDPRLLGVAITALSPAAGGGLWLGTSSRGVVRFKNGTCDFSLPSSGLPQAWVKQLFRSHEEIPWVGTGLRLMRFQEGRWQNVPSGGKSGGMSYAAAAEAGDSILLAGRPEKSGGSWRTRVLRLGGVPAAEVFSPYASGPDWGRIGPLGVSEDSRGRLWLWTLGEGVYFWAGSNGWRRLDTPAMPKWTKVSATLADPDGLIWVASLDGELFRISEQLATMVRQPAELDQNIIQTCAVTRDGTLWLGTDAAGVFRFEEGRLVQETNGLASLRAQVIFEDSQTNLWVGTYAGLHRWDGRQFRRLRLAGLNQGHVRALCEDRAGNLWIGNSTRGLARLAPNGELTWYDASAGLKSYNIRAIVEDAAGTIWVSAPPRGLYRLVGDQFESLLKDRWAGANSIHALLPDPDGGLWITTYGKGLFFFKDGVFRQWSMRAGLPDLNLHGIAADEAGNLWIGSNRGIFGCARKNLLDYQTESSAPVPCWRLTTADGLVSKMTSGSGQPVVSRSADGRFWFPNMQALAVFDPKEVVSLRRSFQPVFEEVVSDGVVCWPAADGVFRLPSGVRSLELHYSCAALAAPEILRFRYQLEGNDVRWTEARNQRVAYYGRLAPGDYRFRVMAAGTSGEWRETERSLLITIVPFWWERPVVKLAAGTGVLVLMVTGAWMVGRARLRRRMIYLERQRALERERTRIAQDLHDDIGAHLTRLSLDCELAGRETVSATDSGSHLAGMARRVNQLIRAMDEIVWTVNPRHDSVASLASYLQHFSSEFFESSDIRCRADVQTGLPEATLGAAARHTLLLAIKEACNNVAKHSNAAEVWLTLRCHERTLAVTVEDDGRGFDPAQAGSRRNGLVNMRNRLEEVGGACVIESQPGKGCRVHFTLPF